jgi:hypothetical protein
VKPQAVFSVGARYAQKEQQQGKSVASHQSRGKAFGFVDGIWSRSRGGLPRHQDGKDQGYIASFCVGAQSNTVQVENRADGIRR